ncbi:hypothetical protein SNOG_11017 [Parastagonospora nodorum SN15]|uniref:Uncharacterized protein n=2 Tax=Phaeosphaeria nodorum (strain SN15 / ATCC MYA-4574 / FGSC 10173) TaxID=321614 RepID=Q0UB47_PHANO|nr:hypothetical protein SNOG_11017 [Parastagonospora nodorum SN15]EAT81516.1 hypothetical protein SNOG_11017 [Parastagonospora nodorum SN15]
MSSRSTRSSASQTSTSSSATMTSIATQPSSHPFLTPGRASTISSWQLSLPERQSHSQTSLDAQAASRQAAVDAYQQLKIQAESVVHWLDAKTTFLPIHDHMTATDSFPMPTKHRVKSRLTAEVEEEWEQLPG